MKILFPVLLVINYILIDSAVYEFDKIMLLAFAISFISVFVNISQDKNDKNITKKCVSNFLVILLLINVIEYINSNIAKLMLLDNNLFNLSIMGIVGFVIIPGIMAYLPFGLPKVLNPFIVNIADKNKTQKIDKLIDVSKLSNQNLTKFQEDKSYFYNDNMELEIRKPEVIYVNNDNKEELMESICQEMFRILKVKHNKFIEAANFKEPENLEEIKMLSNKYGSYLESCFNKKEEFVNLCDKRIKYIQNHYNSAKVGREGEEYVDKELLLYDNFYNLSNIRIEVKDSNGNLQSIENDNIVISIYGVFVLEVKNFGTTGNYDIEIERDGRWLKKYRNNRPVETMKSATSQNNRHIALLNRYINQILNRSIDNYIDADGIVVIANDKISIKNKSENQKIFRASEVYPYIRKQSIKLSKTEMDLLKTSLLRDKLPIKEYPIYDYRRELIHNFNKFCDLKNTTIKNLNIITRELDI
ncbi:hypothetical protein DZE40_001760 [Clostridium beijerinckii]|uniref:Nuclease-related domain protein n=2 Tax=Clostridium beijerinckii TaxID=1520 RepID=A0A1S8S1I3_CLOBE|nr:hypothetical protein [Clostridium beijerinckii]OOM59284.1 nuclease-related domain protein [Clostridium beijerinckii]